MNATLAFITDPRDMQTADSNTYYLTAFTITRDGTIFPDIGSFQSHGFKCDLQYLYCPGRENGHETCVILNKGGHLNLTECYSAQYYACMRPGSCPPGYTLYNSRCYKVINKSPFSNFLDALDTCNYDGAALAYPQDIDTLNYLVTFAQSNMTGSTPTTMNFAIGFTNIWHDLTINNIYEPSNDVVAAVQSLNRSANSNCTFLSVTNSDQWVLTPASINTTFTYAICEFRGPLGCWDDTPYYENFSVNGNLPGNTVNQRLNYSCWPGYYVNGVVGSEWSQYLWCYGQLGGWFPRQPPLDPCIGIDVCNETFPPAPPGIVMTPDTNPRYKTHKLNYNCAANGMSNLVGQSSQKLVCTKYNESYYNYVGPNITECQRCLNINLLNANTTSLSTDVWTIGEQVTVTCNYSYQVSHNVSTQEITCTSNGWQFLPCQKVCLEVPEVRNATTDWRDKMWRVNDNVTATCLGNLYFALLKSQTRKVLCTDNGWDNSTGCDEVCLDNAVVVNATVDLHGKYWLVGSTVPAVCNANHMFLQEENNTVSIMCTSLGWENRTGCALVCEGKPNLQQANTDWNSTSIYPVGSTVTATCLSGYLLPGGGQEYQVECTDSGWNVTVMCKKACTDEPQVVNATTNYTSSGAWLVGSFVYAVCQENFTFTKYSSSSRRVNCTLTGWDNTPPCQEIVPTYPCNVPPVVTNAITSWINKTWTTGEKVNVICLNLHYFSDFTQQQQLQCLEGGWENITGCQKPSIVDECNIQPVVKNATIAWENQTWFYGSNVTAKCFSGYMFVAENVTELPIMCTDNGWQNQTGCQAVCLGEPSVEGATINVSSRVWLLGDRVNVTCHPGLYFLPDGNQSQMVECLKEGWQNVTACEAACVEEPDYENANWVWDYGVWKAGESLPANCTDQHLTEDGVTNTSFTCTSNGWLIESPCLKVCEGEPVVNNATTTWTSGMWLEGKQVTAKCKPHNHFSPKVIYFPLTVYITSSVAFCFMHIFSSYLVFYCFFFLINSLLTQYGEGNIFTITHLTAALP
ncbi:complement factor H-like [Cherax quadricarinatus]|uniref:complement factor H-like n=1 Tax=Cherax quadricarinatus TaxID=27406 RepID=UPI00387E6A34